MKKTISPVEFIRRVIKKSELGKPSSMPFHDVDDRRDDTQQYQQRWDSRFDWSYRN